MLRAQTCTSKFTSIELLDLCRECPFVWLVVAEPVQTVLRAARRRGAAEGNSAVVAVVVSDTTVVNAAVAVPGAAHLTRARVTQSNRLI